nr:MauE/DoxX family redox-associated membrane protein [Kibdelosporangium sp. MJ126-NF4]CEL18112.1 hypothetical protein [Kibdelosporangium sp. MJ126-NF4]CTQ90659.1 hypothetical protein [Kibdelosporangium sp. MJ126-NF4]
MDLVDAQTPLLAVLLLLAGAAKFLGRGPAAGAVVLLPPRHRRLASLGLASSEIALGLALVFSGHLLVRTGVAAMLIVAAGVVGYLWRRRPEAGCGCFGDASGSPVGVRTFARTALIAVAALVALGGRGPAFEAPFSAVMLLEIVVLVALSPELDGVVRRIRGRSDVPCAYRWVPVADTVRVLRRSVQWRQSAQVRTAAEPLDVWRDLCWRIFTYPGRSEGRAVNVVFAVHLDGKRPEIRAVVVASAQDEVLQSL